MQDLISRLSEIRSNYNCMDENEEPYYRALSEAIQLVSAGTDLSAYSDKLWRAAYERGKKEAGAERKRGKWIPVTNGRGGHECNLCHDYAPSWQTGEERLTNFCPECGADMRGEQDG